MTANAVVPAYLGWGNPKRDTESLRLYAMDDGAAPRWDQRYPSGRVAEVGIRERLGAHEGDRFLIIRVGDRFTPDSVLQAVAEAAQRAIEASEP